MSYIQDIGTAVPKNFIRQSDFADIYSRLTPENDIKRKIKFLTAKSAISKRHCVEPDIEGLYKQSLSKKLSTYHKEAVLLAEQAIISNSSFEKHRHAITDIITISCTGMQAPGVEIELINRLRLSATVRRYNINLMGCYAGITGLRLASELCSQPGRTVLIVSVELCTLHFQNKFTDDYLLSNSLFADGAASVIMTSEQGDSKLVTSAFESRLIPNTWGEMSWKISSDGFLMTLSSDVPKSIGDSLQRQQLFDKQPSEVNWAIHPGGKQILDSLESLLHLLPTENQSARAVLEQYGNMSSATIFFVLKEVLKMRNANHLDHTIACAFGPGLTLEAMLVSHV